MLTMFYYIMKKLNKLEKNKLKGVSPVMPNLSLSFRNLERIF